MVMFLGLCIFVICGYAVFQCVRLVQITKEVKKSLDVIAALQGAIERNTGIPAAIYVDEQAVMETLDAIPELRRHTVQAREKH